MKKKEIVVLFLVIISLITVSLYQTLATDITMNKTNVADVDLSYTFDITDQTGRVVNVKAGATKILDIFVINNNNGTINYGIAYTPSSVKTDDITIAQLSASKDSVSGLINKNEKKQITIIIINNSDNDISLTLVPITGYEHGGDLIVPDNYTLITEKSESYSVSLMATNGTISGGNTLTNLIENGSYEDGSNNWSLSNATITNAKASEGNNSLLLQANTTAMSTQILNEKSPTLSHKYYGRLKFLSSTNFTTLDNRFEWYYNDNTDALLVFANKNTQNLDWKLLSNIGSINSSTYLSNTWNIRNFVVNANTESYVDELLLIDLTKSFGAGNEPSKEWLDSNLKYFDGSVSYRTDEIMSGNDVSFSIVPESGYEFESLDCNGGIYDEFTNTLTISNITSNINCSINFKRSINTATDYIENLLVSNHDTMNNDDPDGNIRYMGENPKNYVSFNNELWRIIGVFNVTSSEEGITEKRLKIINNETIGEMTWDNNNSNNWSVSSLQKYLNGTYLNSLNSVAQSMVSDTLWNIGGTSIFADESNGLASHWYNYERGTTVYSNNPSKWTGKIGLMYPSDYGYATSGGSTTDKNSCLSTALYKWSNSSYSDCKNNNYLFDSKLTQWTMISYSGLSDHVFYINLSGFIINNYVYREYDILPVLYLKSTVQITGGTGTSQDPYILSIN